MLVFNYNKNISRFIKLGVFGAILAVVGLIIYVLDPVRFIIKSLVVLTPNSPLFPIWQSPPFDVLISARIFNITNVDGFLNNGEKLNLQEVGPYVYQEILTNSDGHFNDNGTLTYYPKRKLIFRRELSVGDPTEDIVTSVNIPLLGISSYLYDSSFLMNFALNQIATRFNSSTIVKLSVEEYLWGYDDELVKFAHKILPGWIDFDRFGIFERMMANDNDNNIITIKTTSDIISSNPVLTEDERSAKYSITRFNGSPGLPLWGYNENRPEKNNVCNTIEGSYDGCLFPTDLDKNVSLRVYRPAFCRPVLFKYEDEGTYRGFNIYNYRVDKDFLASAKENPANECFCYKGYCPKKGVGLLTPCYYEMPVSISQPHFYNADESLTSAVVGMKPDRELHDSTVKLHPGLGAPIHASLKIQINLNINTKYNSKTVAFNGLVLPLFWLQLDMSEIPDSVNLLLKLLYTWLPLGQTIVSFLFVLIGVTITAVSVLYSFNTPNVEEVFEDPYDKIGYSPIKVIPIWNLQKK
jgi:scavenger receptor class B protein 1